MLDCYDNLTDPTHRPRILLEDIVVDHAMVSACTISSAESYHIDSLLDDSQNQQTQTDPLSARFALSQFCSSIGATEAHLEDVLFPDFVDDDEPIIGDLDLDHYMTACSVMTNTCGVTPVHLSKIWRIDVDTAEKTIAANSQNCV